MNSFTFGQYIATDSFVHSLDPRTKLALTVVLMIAALSTLSPVGLVSVGLALAILILLSKVAISLYWHGIKPMLIIIAITVAFQVFLIPGKVLFHWWIFTATYPGVTLGALMAYRLFIVFFLAQLLTFTTSPLELTDGLENILRPLKRVKVPVHELAMVMTIALRFIPVFFEESERITKAQMSRGADFSSSFTGAFRNLISIIVPLLARAFQRADDLAIAMESRCYAGGTGRTRLHQIHMRGRDHLLVVLSFAYIVIILLLP
ncbi:MAG: energy-coupling factor transporter transmembrane component T family protein [Acidobacteriota bacterium]